LGGWEDFLSSLATAGKIMLPGIQMTFCLIFIVGVFCQALVACMMQSGTRSLSGEFAIEESKGSAKDFKYELRGLVQRAGDG
jgi:hypothetical protein